MFFLMVRLPPSSTRPDTLCHYTTLVRSGAKPWKQKGTGRARAGSSRAPHWTGGGVTHAPKPRDYAQRTPKKMIRLALKSALSDRAANDRVIVLDWGLDAPSTQGAIAALAAHGVPGRAPVGLRQEDEVGWKSLRNLEIGRASWRETVCQGV